MKVKMRTWGLLFALSMLATQMVFAQATNSADVTGTVTDPTGAVLPGVSVTIKDVDKGLVSTVATNKAGVYDSGPVIPNDHYTITFKRQGFTTLQRGPMVLQVGTTGMNVQLSVGQATQKIEVKGTAPLLQTTSGELSKSLSTKTLHTLPLTAGTPDWEEFLVLLPGVSGVAQGGNSVSNPGMSGVAANGSMPFMTTMLDGSNVSSPMSDNELFTPIFGTIAEVKVSDSDFSAQYGTGGIVYNQISKGGTNKFHGSAYDYFQNTALNAANYAFGTGTVPVIHWNDFGFQVSGPVIKNKVFFLFAWDHTISHGGASVGFATVPTAAMRSGDFTGLPTIYDPTTQVVSGSTVNRQSFASEYGSGNKIPSSMIDPVAKAIQAIFPLPNLPGTVNNYQYITPSSSRVQKYFGRFDASVTQKDRLTGSSSYNYRITPGTSPVAPINATNIDVENLSAQLSWVHIFSANLLNDARSGFMGEYDLFEPQTLGGGWPQKLGLKYAHANIFPQINIAGFYGLGPNTHANYRENTFDESDVATMIRGRHTLHFGGEMLIERADSTAWGNINGATLGFTGAYTESNNQSPLGGSSYADFLLGYVNNWSASVTPTYYGRLKDSALFVQDNWKVTPKLTLDLGLRWEGRTGWSDPITKNERSFSPTIVNPATGKPGAMWYALTHVNGRTQLQNNRWNNWLPRIGVAYQLGSKMTVHGGFGLYTFPWNVDNYASCCLGNAIASSGSESDSTGNIAPVAFLDGTGNENPQGAEGASINSLYVKSPTTPEAHNGQSVPYIPYDQPLPELYQWNLTIQRQLAPNMMAQVAYVGSHGKDLIFNTNLNQVPEGLLAPNDSSSRPYPEYQAINGFTTQGVSNYNALQGEIEHRFSKGLMFNVNYTWSWPAPLLYGNDRRLIIPDDDGSLRSNFDQESLPQV